VPRILKLLTSN